MLSTRMICDREGGLEQTLLMRAEKGWGRGAVLRASSIAQDVARGAALRVSFIVTKWRRRSRVGEVKNIDH